jgi:hypothetical protein
MFVVLGRRKLTIPNTDCDRSRLSDLLRQAGISDDEWMKDKK